MDQHDWDLEGLREAQDRCRRFDESLQKAMIAEATAKRNYEDAKVARKSAEGNFHSAAMAMTKPLPLLEYGERQVISVERASM